jgi:hypothetical protein
MIQSKCERGVCASASGETKTSFLNQFIFSRLSRGYLDGDADLQDFGTVIRDTPMFSEVIIVSKKMTDLDDD